jgi:hypothetical protein
MKWVGNEPRLLEPIIRANSSGELDDDVVPELGNLPSSGYIL